MACQRSDDGGFALVAAGCSQSVTSSHRAETHNDAPARAKRRNPWRNGLNSARRISAGRGPEWCASVTTSGFGSWGADQLTTASAGNHLLRRLQEAEANPDTALAKVEELKAKKGAAAVADRVLRNAPMTATARQSAARGAVAGLFGDHRHDGCSV